MPLYIEMCAIAAEAGWSVRVEAADPSLRNCRIGTPGKAARFTRGDHTCYFQTRILPSGFESFDVFNVVDGDGNRSSYGYKKEAIDVLRGGTGGKTVGLLRPATKAALFQKVTGRSAAAVPAEYEAWLTENAARYVSDISNGAKILRSGASTKLVATDLYRLFDSSGHLLYVGITTKGASRRASQHRNLKDWFEDEVAERRVTTFPSWEEARTAELQAIKSENPKYNEASKPNWKPPQRWKKQS